MSCEVVAKALSFVGGVLTLAPSIHIGWREWQAYRLRPGRRAGPAIKEAWKRAASSLRERLQENGALYFALTVLGLAVVTAGFGLDLACEFQNDACNPASRTHV